MIVIQNKAIIAELQRLGVAEAFESPDAPVDARNAASKIPEAWFTAAKRAEEEALKLVDKANPLVDEADKEDKKLLDSKKLQKFFVSSPKTPYEFGQFIEMVNRIDAVITKLGYVHDYISVIDSLISHEVNDLIPEPSRLRITTMMKRAIELSNDIGPIAAWSNAKRNMVLRWLSDDEDDAASIEEVASDDHNQE